MSRITPLDPAQAPEAVRPMFEAVRAALGVVPNFVRVLGVAPAALEGFLGLFVIAGKGALSAGTRERIALAVAERNACGYCLAAHTALARGLEMDEAEIMAARGGTPAEAKDAAAVLLARALVDPAGEISSAAWDAARAHLSEEEVVEVIAHVALNLFTNILGKATRVAVDFPRALPLAA